MVRTTHNYLFQDALGSACYYLLLYPRSYSSVTFHLSVSGLSRFRQRGIHVPSRAKQTHATSTRQPFSLLFITLVLGFRQSLGISLLAPNRCIGPLISRPPFSFLPILSPPPHRCTMTYVICLLLRQALMSWARRSFPTTTTRQTHGLSLGDGSKLMSLRWWRSHRGFGETAILVGPPPSINVI